MRGRAYHAPMENRSRIIVIALVAVLALVVGFGGGALLTGSRGNAPRPSAEALASPGSSADGSPTDEATTEPTDTPEAATESPSAAASTAAAPAATMSFQSLFLDAADNPNGADRVITWTSATGAVKATVASVSPMGNIKMCLKTPTKTLGCRTAGSGTLSAKTTKPKETFILTLRGEATAQPIVNVTLNFQAKSPKVAIENARFDGTAYPDTNGIQALVTPRADGKVGVTAEWGGHPFLYEIDLIEQGGSGSVTYKPDTGSIGTDTQLDVTAPNPWKLVLQNTESGNGITPMNATVSWP